MSEKYCSRWMRWGVIALVLMAPARPAIAQSGGTISGTVTDAQSGVLPGVNLTLRNVESGVTRSTVSEADGHYRVSGVPPGRYDLRVELQGFTTVEVQGITVVIEAAVRRDVTLSIETVRETVTVVGEAPMIETTKSDLGGVVTQQQIETLPVNSRQALLLGILMPGIMDSGNRRTEVVTGSGSSFGYSQFTVDGVENQTALLHASMDFPQAAIQEFKISLGQSKAEHGWSSGGGVDMVTKSGTNAYNGEVFEYFRDKSLNAMNKFEKAQHDLTGAPKPDFRRHQFGGTLGGPIVKDRIHFFGTVELTHQDQTAIVTTGKPQFFSALEGTFPSPYTKNLVIARVDWQVTPKQSLFVRYGQEHELQTCATCGGTTSAFGGRSVLTPRIGVVAGHTWAISSRMLNEIRVQRLQLVLCNPTTLDKFSCNPGQDYATRQGPAQYSYIFPSLTYGFSRVFGQVYKDQWREFRDDLSFNSGKHSMKAGVYYSDVPVGGEGPADVGTWTFSTDQTFNPSNPATVANLRSPTVFTARIGTLYDPRSYQRISVYGQDDWQLWPNVTFNLGARYDVQSGVFNETLDVSIFPRPLPFIDPGSRGDKNNFGPRAGVAWDVRNDGRSVVRAAYGRYYNAVGFGSGTVNALEIRNLRQPSIRIANPNYPDPYQGQSPAAFVSTAPPNITILANDARNMTADSVSVGVSQAITQTLSLHVDGLYSKSDGDLLIQNINQADPITKLRPLPEWGQIDQAQSLSRVRYKGLFVRLDKRFAQRHQYTVSYALAKSLDNNSGGNSSPRITDSSNPGLDYGPANSDHRHTLTVSGSVMLPADVSLAAVYMFRSSLPFSALAGRDLNGDTFVTDFVPGTSRNGRGDDNFLTAVNAYRVLNGRTAIPESQLDSSRFSSLDLKVLKAFRLGASRRFELIFQVFNVLGTENLPFAGSFASSTGNVNNALSDTFGRIQAALNRQQGEIGVRVAW